MHKNKTLYGRERIERLILKFLTIYLHAKFLNRPPDTMPQQHMFFKHFFINFLGGSGQFGSSIHSLFSFFGVIKSDQLHICLKYTQINNSSQKNQHFILN